MFAKSIIGLLLVVLAVDPSAVKAQGALPASESGFIIRVMDRLLFIDMGRQVGVREGDIFDIVEAEVVTHPLSGDTLSVTPRNVGALRVRQVYPKMALAELMHIQAGRDPMLMRIAPIQNPERLLEVERFLKQNPVDGGPPRRLALLPGVYQYTMGSRWKGMGLLGMELAALGTGIAYRISSDDWFNQYSELPPGLAPDRYDFYFDEASNRRSISNRLFWLAGAVYVYNLIDVMWMGNGGVSMKMKKSFSMGVSYSRDGAPLVQLMRRF